MHINLPSQFDDLKSRCQFVCWRPRPKKDGGISKIPINPKTGYQASTSKPETWGTIADCEALLASNAALGGIGIVTGQGIGAIDLDDCFVDGIMSDFAIDVLDAMSSYAELSPSGRGVHNAVLRRYITDYDDDLALSADTSAPLRRNSQYPARTDDQVLAALFSRAKNADKCKLLYDGHWKKCMSPIAVRIWL